MAYFSFEELSITSGRDLVWLADEDYAKFAHGKTVEMVDSRRQLVIVLPVQKESRFLEFDPSGDINWFISNARFGNARDGTLWPDCEGGSLREVLEAAVSQLSDHIPPVSLDSVLNHENRYFVWHDPPTDLFEKTIQENSDFVGMTTECGCGVPGCSAEYAWIKNDVCMFYLSVVAVGWNRIELLPFRIDRKLSAETPNFVRRPCNVLVPMKTKPMPLPD